MERLQHHWYRITPLHLLLFPLSLFFGALVFSRRLLYRSGILASVRLPAPVVIVGNISVGGTGKTPLTLWLAQQLIENGWHPGIVSRGYTKNGKRRKTAREVSIDDAADEVGDEPLLMAQRALCPVWIGRDRPAAASALLQAHPECDIILSDDGLQHYRLQRDAEIVVVDGARRFGNGLLLPAGPLREPVSRMRHADAIVINGGDAQKHEFAMTLNGSLFYNLLNPGTILPAGDFAGKNLHAIAGIGHPKRFFSHLEHLGLVVQQHAFPDHHRYAADDIALEDAEAILMTEKDAVKCSRFATERCWVLRVDAQVSPALTQLILKKVTP
ncbi:tetraacyldisaccharide 4'-kinase [Sideroxydans lithotrophicus]|uniref:Tetraacyldisaccharide 4'-kinase n=1 Tax=Sideroxydans lithotrophicus (strain ES-1) TaxID=580332 RepID=D5CRL5_SIDLE|nr:tetraacyldisaccharide 4'-kinase [Sideroxydans lithotrophicus]ADE11601.1 tetraacyldisaccharide 4'-kinase [Sideroxydans lithotrophicus ES-1]